MIDRVGQQLGNYQLVDLLGRGNWATVYLGEHVHLHTRAAIKVLHESFAQSEIEGFLSEAQTLASLQHPHIVRVLDFGVQEGVPFLVMDYASGGTLRQLHPKGTRLPLDMVLSYVKQVASALHYAHEQRLIHRDIKPENLLLGPDQEIWLSDFGLAVVAHSAHSQLFHQAAGSLAYMAPEQLEGHPTPASDQYALGVLVYEWLCGERPFSGSVPELVVKQTLALPLPLSDRVPTIPAMVEQVVLQALAKDSKQRFVNVQAFALALEAATRGDTSGQTQPVLASQYSVEAKHRESVLRHLPTGTVTLLFSDIEGSTSLLQQLGERYSQVLGEYRQLLRSAFHRWHGHEVDTQGDSFFVAFARASDAVSAAVEAQRALARHAWSDGVTVKVRMGVHTGEPQLSTQGYVGLDVHHAARIMSAGYGGQMLLSQTTRDLVVHDLPDDVSLRDLGAHRLKDLQRKSQLFQLVIAGLPADFPPLKSLDAHPNNLPVQLTSLIGRELEVAAALHFLQHEQVRLLTLTGVGGTGKTRLALQVAAELSEAFSHGVYFVDLAPLSDPTLVVPTIAQAFDLRETGEQPLLDLLKGHLRDKQLLLLLDNFEQVASAALQVVELLASCPHLKVIVTSRAVLHVRGEQEFPVSPLAVPDPKRLPELVALSHYEAVELFVSRAQAVKPEFQLSKTNAPVIAEICARLDGLPLAIELAAARIKLLPPQVLLARLDQRFAVLTSGPHDAPARQQTLRNTISWSYNLLEAQEQQLFQRLAVFVGGCTLEAIEAVCTALDGSHEAVSVLEGVASLLNKSLLQQTELEGSEPRLVMLLTIREYGLECLAVCGEKDACQQAHAHYYLSWTEEAVPELEGPRQAAWFKSLEREHDNLRAVLQWSIEQGGSRHNTESIEIALRLAGALREFWIGHGHYSEGRAFLEQALSQSTGFQTAVRMKALIAAGALANLQDESDLAKMLCEESLALGRELGDKQGIALSLYQLGCIARNQGQYEEAHILLKDALACWREMGDKKDIAWSLFQLASILLEQGEYARALSLLRESLANQREVGNKTGIANSLFMLAQALFEIQEDPTSVRSLLEEGLELFRELDNTWGLSASFYLSGKLALVEGDTDSASLLLEESVILCREMGQREVLAESLIVLGRVRAIQGNHAVARRLYEESLAIARSVNARVTISLALEGLAGAVATQGELEWAARLWGASDSLRQAIGAPLSPVERARYEQEITAARTQLGEKRFAEAWSQGVNMTIEQVLSTQELLLTPEKVPSGLPLKRPSSTYTDGLTPREVEVLVLVAQGLTDAQVAEQLVISPRTVNWHLTSIYSKLQVTSRSAATRYAIVHHLI